MYIPIHSKPCCSNLILFLSFLCFFKTLPAFSQWQQTSGPEGGPVLSLFAQGDTIFAGSFGNVHFSDNNGMTWQARNDGLLDSGVNSFIVTGSTIYIGTNQYGIFLSKDNGKSWVEANENLIERHVNALAVIDSNLIAGTIDGIFVTSLGKKSWRWINYLGARSFAVRDTLVFAGVGSRLFLSHDKGLSWVEMGSIPFNSVGILSLVVKDLMLFAGTGNGGLYLSTDDGKTWNPVNSGLPDFRVNSLLSHGSDLFAGTGGRGIFVSPDNGVSWTAVNTGLTERGFFVSALEVSGRRLLAGTSDGLFASADNGLNWFSSNDGLIATTINALAVEGGNIFAGTGHVFLTSDNGAIWNKVSSELPSMSYIETFLLNDSSFFAVTLEHGIFRSRDKGRSWTTVSSGLTTLYLGTMVAQKNHLFIPSLDGLFLSADDGDTWSRILDRYVSSIVFSDSNLFAAVPNEGVYLSQNYGVDWTPVNAGLTNLSVRQLGRSGPNLFLTTSIGLIFLSTNEGASWEVFYSPLDNQTVNFFMDTDKYFFAATRKGVFVSSDNGLSWSLANAGLPSDSVWVSSLVLNGTNLFAGIYGKGVWLNSSLVTKTREKSLDIPHAFLLSQNYPNPFNPSTIIQFSLPKPAVVTLGVFDILGREVASLVKGKLQTGTHTVLFEAYDLPNGVYFYRLQAGEFIQQRKMLLLQ
jgi:photosystem II stability/assembly factor-like uncharacterized protein